MPNAACPVKNGGSGKVPNEGTKYRKNEPAVWTDSDDTVHFNCREK